MENNEHISLGLLEGIFLQYMLSGRPLSSLLPEMYDQKFLTLRGILSFTENVYMLKHCLESCLSWWKVFVI